jgi:hypothetical protein
MLVGWRAGRLDDENIASANVFIYLKIEFAVRKTLGVCPAHVAAQLPANLFSQLGVCVSGKDLYAAGSTHDIADCQDIADCRLPIADWRFALPIGVSVRSLIIPKLRARS